MILNFTVYKNSYVIKESGRFNEGSIIMVILKEQ